MSVVIAFIIGLFLLMKIIEFSTIKRKDNKVKSLKEENIRTSNIDNYKRILIISSLESLNLLDKNNKVVIKKIKE